MTKIFKVFIFVIATAVMACCLYAVPAASSPVSILYTGVLSLYLGLDMANMITKTHSLPKGEFKNLSRHKYITAGICLAVLLIIGITKRSDPMIEGALTAFISDIMIILACLIGGLEANNIATETGPEIVIDVKHPDKNTDSK